MSIEAQNAIRRYLGYGFYQPEEIARIVGEDILSGAIVREELDRILKEEIETRRQEEELWPEVTDCDRLDRVFDSLNAIGILAIHNAGLTPSEGITEVSEQYHYRGGELSDITGYCFYHRQDMEHVLEYGKITLAFGDIHGTEEVGVEVGRQISDALEKAGFDVQWSGSIRETLVIRNFQWQRRMP